MPFCEGSAKVYGRLRAELEKKGISLSEPDMRIASIIVYNDLTVVTGNIKHFSKVPGLKVENWIVS
ncbi:MAG TPA: type II toxin-antitoxin system VapC family toxin [Nitrospirae bacterium]|nr:type II toxin-antitoxin system VapC family toxin [Nitrospirota bacterium]